MADEDIGLSGGEDILSKLTNVINKLQQSSPSNSPDDPINKLAGHFQKLLEQFKTLDEKGKKEMGVNLLKQVSGKITEYQQAQIFNYQIIIFIVCVTSIVLLLVFFGYKLYKNIKEKERKREEKRKAKQQKKKK